MRMRAKWRVQRMHFFCVRSRLQHDSNFDSFDALTLQLGPLDGDAQHRSVAAGLQERCRDLCARGVVLQHSP